MNWSESNVENLRRVFSENFVARDIAEPLASFDASASAEEAARLMDARGYDVVGVRSAGLVAGYVERGELGAGRCGDAMRPIAGDACIGDGAPLSAVVLGLAGAPRLFVRALGAVGGIVTLSDLQKPPVRMWLFGMISLIEMRTTRLIELKCGVEGWQRHLSENRLQKARDLLEERRRRNQDPGLLDCLQLADKGQIIARNEDVRRLTNFQSRRQVEQAIGMIESLRNNLAHSQDIVASDWATIVLLCQDVERIVAGTEAVQQALSSRSADDGR